ncbi:unnamed protein product [Ilex paraguariensis]|uniref:RAVE complex protein Rav1 C-terminal domain-containing protein n=1 Tax=Ilex paraguariensis TaxID=185542 RepID=A0ABC8R1W0_9AQUA
MTAVLVQSTKVEAIKWTGSGDGIISGGAEVVLWRKKGRSWGMTWKFRPELPQALVSTTWSIDGPSAAAPFQQQIRGSSEASKCVFVLLRGGKSEFVNAELRHPLPVSMIQWRPITGKQSKKIDRHPLRQVLLTCCMDGIVRLWSEIDDGRLRKVGKDKNDKKTVLQSFRVAAVIEINQVLCGTLGSDIFVRWATEIDGIISNCNGVNQYFSSDEDQQDKSGRCEWLIGVGPQMQVTLWAIHCLDDVTPVRFPRVSLWKRQEVIGPKVGTGSILLEKVVILRNQVFAPPDICSLVHLLPSNSLAWSQLHSQIASSCCAGGVLNINGHSGQILQVAVNPYGCEFELAASLDTNGLLLFWSISTISDCIMGLPTLNPAWKLSGKIVLQDSNPKYTSMSWAPAVLDEVQVLLVGHVGGIDCFVVNISNNEDKKLSFHNLCTIPFTSYSREEGPTTVYSIPLPSTWKKTSLSNNFMLLAIWKEVFQALSWTVTIHSCDLSGSCCGCSFETTNAAKKSTWKVESNIDGKRYFVAFDPCSSVFPDPHNHDQVTSFAVVCPTSFILTDEEKSAYYNEICSGYSAYHMVTGCSNGSLKLWRSMPNKDSHTFSLWELVGMLAAHRGPITAISLAGCGQKIAITCPEDQSNTSSTLQVWESVHSTGIGSFMLEDTLLLDGEVISLSWLQMGDGKLLLGICLQNELQVYAQRSSGGQNLVKPGKALERNIWFCIASANTYPAICDFFWGPKGRAVVIHDEYFCLFSQCLYMSNKKHQAKCLQTCKSDALDCNSGSDKHIITPIFADPEICDSKKLTVEENGKKCLSRLSMKLDLKNETLSSVSMEKFTKKYDSGEKSGFWSMLDVAEKIGGSLPLYHPEALLMNICSGNWKRAYVALQHLVGYLTSNDASAKRHCLMESSRVIPPVPFSDYLEGLMSARSTDEKFQWSGDASLVTSSLQLQKDLTQVTYSWDSDASNGTFNSSRTRSELSGFAEQVEKFYCLGAVTNTEKVQVLAIIDLLQEVSSPSSVSAYESLDEPGRRFWVAIRFQQLYFIRRIGRLSSIGEMVVDSRLIGWAFHSDCQENLFDSLLPSEPSWQDMRNMGVGFWYTNVGLLRLKMEKLARRQYLKNRDPKECALLYIALNRLQVLAGLFKISKDDKDKLLVGFISRNFQEDKNKAAALKNAYVLLGRHQLELASAFFLLGGDISSAITVCAKNLGDEQLALVICRLVEGYGGSLERHLVSKFMLPSAIERRDYWLASFLEWVLGNYSQAFMRMLGVQMESPTDKSAILSNHASFLDPSIGQYCLMLANKNSMKNAVGEHNAAILTMWAIFMSATALKRCGLPLEALECLSYSLGIFGGPDQGSASDTGNAELLSKMLKPSPNNSFSNWISDDVASHMESLVKLDLAMQYISKLLMEHPSWRDTIISSPGAHTYSECKEKISLENFQQKLFAGIAYFEQKFSLIPLHLMNMIVIYLRNNGLFFIGYRIMQGYISKDPSHSKSNAFGGFPLHHTQFKLLLKDAEEISNLFSRYVVVSGITCSQFKLCSTESSVAGGKKIGCLASWWVHMQGLIGLFWNLRAALKLFTGSCANDFIRTPFVILDLWEYFVYFASAWLHRNYKGLVLLVKPILSTSTNGHPRYKISMADLNELLPQVAESLAHDALIDDVGDTVQMTKPIQNEQSGIIISSIPEDLRWQIRVVSLWGHMSGFLNYQLNSLPEKLVEIYLSHPPCRLSSFVSDSDNSEPEGINIEAQIMLISVVLSRLLKTTCAHIPSYRAKHLALCMQQKVEDGLSTRTLLSLEEIGQSQPSAPHKHFSGGIDSLNMMNYENEFPDSKILWDICADPKIICDGLAQEDTKWSQYIMPKHFNGWSNIYISLMGEHEVEETCDQEGRPGNSIARKETSTERHSFLSSGWKGTMATKKFMPFHSPKELCKRNGELLEALCINSIYQQQAALASNRKGILFFNWGDGLLFSDKSDYIWAEADWPQNGWAGSESTPVPTCVSPGVDLGLGGATVGLTPLARPGRDLTGGGAFGIPGYAGIGASGLGWGIQEDFEEFADPPATAENISTRAFSSHPFRPFFLVGSGNTHIYLWEFGKDKASATYGILPASNFPPLYALASISAVHFDHCGHRFATAALDGTVCAWQLEVGGRSNIHPTESSICFNNHAADVSYVTSSGSIIVAAGYSSNGVNVVIWDTLAPPTTSQASIMCHEGGACSLSVFDSDIGSGSVSPLIVTGGKGGDIGLHDFRYIATGRSKRHRLSDCGEQTTAESGNRIGDQNANGMLWYIPKAHSGSVTKISTIPNTSFFLTGSKDGDVKLWDAKRAKLVVHWPKLHERQTFLQPRSRGFSGVVRAAVTDIQVVSHGFLTCGGDGSVKLVQFNDFHREYE